MGNRKAPTPVDPNQIKPEPPPAPPSPRYTTGPWSIQRNINDLGIISGNQQIAGYIVSKADAKLMAAAPAMRAVLDAVLHQMTFGEAADVLDIGIVNQGSERDLRWCRRQIQQVLKSLD